MHQARAVTQEHWDHVNADLVDLARAQELLTDVGAEDVDVLVACDRGGPLDRFLRAGNERVDAVLRDVVWL